MIPKNSFGGSRALNSELTRRARLLLQTDPRSEASQAHVKALLTAANGVDGAIKAFIASSRGMPNAQKLRAGAFIALLPGVSYSDIASALREIHGDNARNLGKGVYHAWSGSKNQAEQVKQVGRTVAHLIDCVQGKPTAQSLALAEKVLNSALGRRRAEISLAKSQMHAFWSREETRGA